MKNTLTYFLLIITLLMGNYSCSDSLMSENTDQTDSQPNFLFEFQFNQTFFTKGTDTSQESGNLTNMEIFENQINTLHVYIYDNDGKNYIGTVEQISFNGKVFEGKSTAKLEDDKTYRFMIFANCSQPSDPSTNPIYQLKEIEANGIPMWGAFPYKITKDPVQTINNINLLRAISKIEVQLDNSLTDIFELEKVTINKYAKKGYAFPKNWSKKDPIPSSGTLDEKNYFNPILTEEDKNNNECVFKLLSDKAIIYLPEYNNQDNSLFISVTLKEKATQKSYIYENSIAFKNYNNKEEEIYNLVRNHLYHFNILSVGSDLTLTVNVNDWILEMREGDYTDEVVIKGGKELTWTEGTYKTIDKKNATVILFSGKTLEGKFTIDTPMGATWFASLIPYNNEGIDRFEFVVKGKGSKNATGEVGKESVIHIRAKALEEEALSASAVILRIMVKTLDDRYIKVNLMPKDLAEKFEEYYIVQPQ